MEIRLRPLFSRKTTAFTTHYHYSLYKGGFYGLICQKNNNLFVFGDSGSGSYRLQLSYFCRRGVPDRSTTFRESISGKWPVLRRDSSFTTRITLWWPSRSCFSRKSAKKRIPDPGDDFIQIRICPFHTGGIESGRPGGNGLSCVI